MEVSSIAHFPKIEPATIAKLRKIAQEHELDCIVVREKIDGSNFTIFNDGNQLHFYNKNSEITGDKLSISVFEYSVAGTLLAQKQCKERGIDAFRPGYTYHCEALRRTRASHIRYARIPRYHIICYEIILPNGTNATPEQLTEILHDTGIEEVPVLWSNVRKSNSNISTSTVEYESLVAELIKIAESIDVLPSCLGNTAEGFVLTVLNREKKDKLITMRVKFVATHMKERKDIGATSNDGFENNQTVTAIGDMFNVAPRFIKAANRLEEKAIPITSEALNIELDADLEAECRAEILEMLWQRCWPTIKKAARANLYTWAVGEGIIQPREDRKK